MVPKVEARYSPQTARAVKASFSLALAPPGEQPIFAMSSYWTSVQKQKEERSFLIISIHQFDRLKMFQSTPVSGHNWWVVITSNSKLSSPLMVSLVLYLPFERLYSVREYLSELKLWATVFKESLICTRIDPTFLVQIIERDSYKVRMRSRNKLTWRWLR